MVELVVVIAILGILAAIAVPRLLGFQERARAQADRQTAVQIRNAMALLYANGELDIEAANATYTVSATDDSTTVSDLNTIPAATSGSESTDVEALVEELTGDVSISGTNDIIVTAVNTDGEIEVTQPAGLPE